MKRKIAIGLAAAEIMMEDHSISEENINGEITMQPWEFWILSEEE